MQSTLVFLHLFSVFLLFLFFSSMVRKTRANKKTTTPCTPVFESDRFRIERNQATYEKLNIYRLVWAECKVILNELNGQIRRNFESRGWLPLLDVEHLLLLL